MLKSKIVLAAGLALFPLLPAVSQEPAQPPPSAVPTELAGLRVERVIRHPVSLRIKEVTDDKLALTLPTNKASSEPEHLATFRKGDFLPEPNSDWVITSLVVRRVKKHEITCFVPEIGLRNSQTGHDFTFVVSDTDTPVVAAVLRSGDTRFQVKSDGEFSYPASAPTRYKVLVIQADGMSIRRLSDGCEFRIPWQHGNPASP